MLHIISLGAGVQSSTMALMAAHGEITPMPDCAIFADTQAEPRKVYEWLDWLEKQLPFPVHRVIKAAGLRENIISALAGGRFAVAPFYTESPTSALGGMLRRQCTREFKVEPIVQQTRRLLGIGKGVRAPKGISCVQSIGISTDEASRMKPSREHYIEHRWPLIELNMSRADCLTWMESNGYPKPGKSACTFCPYHDDKMWQDMKINDPESWADAVNIDNLIRSGVRGTTQKLYLHDALKPLSEIDFQSLIDAAAKRTAELAAERARQGIFNFDAPKLEKFDDECEGMCGV